jgi:hypothetical protein
MRSLLISWLSFQILIPTFVAGYKIDQSCEDKGIAKDIRNAMTSAFERASGAYTTLTSPPLSADALELLGFLFTKDGANPAELISQGKLEKTIGVLQGINTNMRNKVTGDASVRPEDVVRAMPTKDPKTMRELTAGPDHILPLRPLEARGRRGGSLGRFQYLT